MNCAARDPLGNASRGFRRHLGSPDQQAATIVLPSTAVTSYANDEQRQRKHQQGISSPTLVDQIRAAVRAFHAIRYRAVILSISENIPSSTQPKEPRQAAELRKKQCQRSRQITPSGSGASAFSATIGRWRPKRSSDQEYPCREPALNEMTNVTKKPFLLGSTAPSGERANETEVFVGGDSSRRFSLYLEDCSLYAKSATGVASYRTSMFHAWWVYMATQVWTMAPLLKDRAALIIVCS